MINPLAKLTAEEFLFAQRFFYFIYEALIGIGYLIVLVAQLLILGTFLINAFGDIGGFVWLGISYAEFLLFDPTYNKIVRVMRAHLPQGVMP